MLGLTGLAAAVGAWALGYVALRVLQKRRFHGRDWHRDWVAVGVLAMVTAAFYWPLLFTESWIPKGGGDLASFLYPVYAFAARSLRQGTIPLWNPHLYLGMPFAADNQSGLFYPINLLTFLASPELTYETVEWLAVCHVFLAGLFGYLYLRDLPTQRSAARTQPAAGARPRMGRVPAVAGAVAYMLSDLFVVHPGNLNIIATAAWLPLALLCMRRALIRRRLGWAGATGIVLGVAALAGHAQMFLYLAIAVTLYALYHAFLERGAGWVAVLGTVGRLAFAGIVSFGVAALALVPALDLTRYTVRATMAYAEASGFSIPPAGLIGAVLPGFFGRGTGPFWGPWERTEMGYAGVTTLVLVGVAVATTWRRSALTRFCVLLASLALLTALGPYAIVHGLTYALIPVFRQLRVPARAIVLANWSTAVLAAVGLDVLLGALSRRVRLWLRRLRWGLIALWGGLVVVGLPVLGHAVLTSRAVVPTDVLAQHVTSLGSLVVLVLLLGAATAGLWARLAGALSRSALGALATIAIAVDLLSLGAYVEVEPNDPLVGYRHEPEIAMLQSDPEVFRVETTAEVHGGWSPDWALLYGMDDLNGIWNPLRLGAYDVLTWVGIQREDPFYNLYNVKYLITSPQTPVPDHFVLVWDGGEHRIYQNTAVLPRAFVVYDVVLASGDISALQAARAEGFDPRTQLALKQSSGAQSTPGAQTGDGEATVVRRGPNDLDLRVTTPADGYLFVGEMWMPGWVAYVDGEETEVLQANYTFRAVRVPAGTHDVHLAYKPAAWTVGLSLTLATVVGHAVWGACHLVRRRGQRT
ncbi:MAG: YfhO family protein [Anaerolineae bacterium]|nr:YfhO family protein [Anaerolineae bacterium]